MERLEQPIEQLAAGVVDGHRLAQAREAVHLLVRVVGLDEAVRVEQDVAARGDDALGLLVVDVRHESERHAGRAELDDAVVRADVGQVVPGVGHDDPARLGLQDREQAGHEHPGRHLRLEQRVGAGEDLARESLRLASARRIECVRAMTSAAGTPLSVTSPTAMPDAPAGHLDEVVEVATDRPRRTVVGGDLPLRQVRQLARQELLLDQGRDAHLLFHALALGGLVRLLADELGDADRGRGLRGEGRQEPAVVGRVVLLRQARTEVERADQLALGDERDDQRDAGVAERVTAGDSSSSRARSTGPGADWR